MSMRVLILVNAFTQVSILLPDTFRHRLHAHQHEYRLLQADTGTGKVERAAALSEGRRPAVLRRGRDRFLCGAVSLIPPVSSRRYLKLFSALQNQILYHDKARAEGVMHHASLL